jgi:hypothetical protein
LVGQSSEMKNLLLATLLLLAGCAASPPKLSGHLCQDFPVYAPSEVKSQMGGSSGEAIGDPNAEHHLTYWLKTDSKPDQVVAFYKEKMKTLPSAKEITGEEKYDNSLLQFTCGPTSAGDRVKEFEVIVEKEPEDGKTIFRVSETLKPGLKYPD